MPDDHNVSSAGARQPESDPVHFARVKFASDSVRKKVDDLLAESGGSLAPVDEEERQRIATRLRKARAAAPLNLLPLLTLLLAACGKTSPETSGANEAGQDADEAAARSGDDGADEAPSLPEGGWRFVQASTPAGRPSLSPEAEANMVRLCLQAITDNTLQPSAIHEICRLIDLDDVDRTHDVIWRWTAPPRTEGYSTNKVCYLVNAQDLLFWMFLDSPPPARGYAGRVRPKADPELPGDAQADGIVDASLVTVVAAVPEAAAAAGGGFGGGLAALPLLALGGGGGGGGGGGAAALADESPPSAGQVAAPPEQVPLPDIVDEELTLQRDTSLAANAGAGRARVADNAMTVVENTDAGTPLYKVKVPAPDVEGNEIYLYLTGIHAHLFTISPDGALRLRSAANHEARSSYDVTIRAREVATGDGGAGTSAQAPAKAGPQVADAAHRVQITVRDVNDTAPAFNPAEIRQGITEDVALGSVGNQQDGTTIYQASATPDVAGDRVEYSLDESGDNDLFDIDPTTGKVWFISRPGEGDYSFTVIATVGGRSAQRTVNLSVAEGAREPFGQGDDPAEASQITILVVSSRPVAGARIYVDADGDGILDADEMTGAPLGVTDSNGRAVIEVSQDGARYIADVSHLGLLYTGMAWGIYYGQFGDDPLPQGVHVISPLTHLLALNTADRRAEWAADPDRDENSRAFDEQIIADNRNILANYFRRGDPTLTRDQLEDLDVLYILDPATYGIGQARAARADVEERGPGDAPRRVRRQTLEEPLNPQQQEQQPPSSLAAEIEALLEKIATQAALIADGRPVTAAHVRQATTALLAELRAAPSAEPSPAPDEVRPVPIDIPGDPPDGRQEPDLNRFIPTDPNPQDTTRNLGLDVRSRSGDDQTTRVLRPKTVIENDQPVQRPDTVPTPPTRLIADPADPLDVFLGTASYFIVGKYGYLQIQWDAFHEGAGDGPGAWVFAYFTPAHQGYDPRHLTQAAKDAFAHLALDEAVFDLFTFTVTDIAGNRRDVLRAFTATGVNDDPVLTGQIPEQSTNEDVAKTLEHEWFRSIFGDVDDDPDNSGNSFAGVIITGIDNGTLRMINSPDDAVALDSLPEHGISPDALSGYGILPDRNSTETVIVSFRLVDEHGGKSEVGRLTIPVRHRPDGTDVKVARQLVVNPGDIRPPDNAAGPETPVGGTFTPTDPDPNQDSRNLTVAVQSKNIDNLPDVGPPPTQIHKAPEHIPDNDDSREIHSDFAEFAQDAFIIVGEFGYLRIRWVAETGEATGSYNYLYVTAGDGADPRNLTLEQQVMLAAAKAKFITLSQYDHAEDKAYDTAQDRPHASNVNAVGRDVFTFIVTDADGLPKTIEKTFLAFGTNEAPSPPGDTEVNVDAAKPYILTENDISFDDPDNGDTLGWVIFHSIVRGHIDVTPAQGGDVVRWNPATDPPLEVSLADIRAGRVAIIQDVTGQPPAAPGNPVQIRYGVTDQFGKANVPATTPDPNLTLQIIPTPDRPTTTPDGDFLGLETTGLAEGGVARNGQTATNFLALSESSFGFHDSDPGQQFRAVVFTKVTNGQLYLWNGNAGRGGEYVKIPVGPNPHLFTQSDLGQTADGKPRLILIGNDSSDADFTGAPANMVIEYYVVSSSYTGPLQRPGSVQPHINIPVGDPSNASDPKHTSELRQLSIRLLDRQDERPRDTESRMDGDLPVNPAATDTDPMVVVEGGTAGALFPRALFKAEVEAEIIDLDGQPAEANSLTYSLRGASGGTLYELISIDAQTRIVSLTQAPDYTTIVELDLSRLSIQQSGRTIIEDGQAVLLRIGLAVTVNDTHGNAVPDKSRRAINFFLKIENRDNNAPEFMPAPDDVEAVDGVVEIVAPTGVQAGADWLTASSDEIGQQDTQSRATFRVHARDPDNAGGGQTESIGFTKATGTGNKNHNHLVEIAVDGTIAFLAGKFNFERRDIELQGDRPFLETVLENGQNVEKRYFLIEVKATSTSTLDRPDGDIPVDGDRSAVKQVRIYVTNIDDNPPVFHVYTHNVEGVVNFQDGDETLNATVTEKLVGDTTPSLFQVHAVDPDGDAVSYRIWAPADGARINEDGKTYLTTDKQQLANHNHLIDQNADDADAGPLALFNRNGLLRLVEGALDHEHPDAFTSMTGARYLEFHLEALSSFPESGTTKITLQKFRIFLNNLDDNDPEVEASNDAKVPRRVPTLSVPTPREVDATGFTEVEGQDGSPPSLLGRQTNEIHTANSAHRRTSVSREAFFKIGLIDPDNVPGFGLTDTFAVTLIDEDSAPGDGQILKATSPDGQRLLNHNHLVREEIGIHGEYAVLRFLTGGGQSNDFANTSPHFDFENPLLFVDEDGGRFFLIKVRITSTSTLKPTVDAEGPLDPPRHVDRELKIYVSNLNDEPPVITNIGQDIDFTTNETRFDAVPTGEEIGILEATTREGTLGDSAAAAGTVTIRFQLAPGGANPYGVKVDASGNISFPNGLDFEAIAAQTDSSGTYRIIEIKIQAIVQLRGVDGQLAGPELVGPEETIQIRIDDVDEAPEITSVEIGRDLLGQNDDTVREVTASVGGTRNFQVTAVDRDEDDSAVAITYQLAMATGMNDNSRVTITADGMITFKDRAFDFEEARVENASLADERRYFLIQVQTASTGFSGTEIVSAPQDVKIYIEDDGILPTLAASYTKIEDTSRAGLSSGSGVFRYHFEITSFKPPALHDSKNVRLTLYATQAGGERFEIGSLIYEEDGDYKFTLAGPGVVHEFHYGSLAFDGLAGKLVFTPFEGIGSPFDRLKKDEHHSITLQIRGQDRYGRKSNVVDVEIDLEGKNDRPQFITYGTPFRHSGEAVTQDNPATPENEDTVRTEPWAWWDETGIWNWEDTLRQDNGDGAVIVLPRPQGRPPLSHDSEQRYLREIFQFNAEKVELAEGQKTVWRFLAMDLDGSYLDQVRFPGGERGYRRAEGQTDADYAAVLDAFIANMISIESWIHRWPQQPVNIGDHAHAAMFEVVAARDSDGNLITVRYPGSWQNQATGNGFDIPVFELRLKATETLAAEIDYYITVKLNDAPPLRGEVHAFAERLVKITLNRDAPSALDLQAPTGGTLVTAVDETVGDGVTVRTLLGQLLVTAPGSAPRDGWQFTLTNNHLFEIDGMNLYLRAGRKLDYETAPNHEEKLTITLNGTPLSEEYTLDINDVLEPAVPELI